MTTNAQESSLNPFQNINSTFGLVKKTTVRQSVSNEVKCNETKKKRRKKSNSEIKDLKY